MDTISIEKVTYQADGNNILDGIGPFSIQQGDLVCVSGPSGGGKTTFLNLLSGLLANYKGELLWGDINIAEYSNNKNIDKLRMDWIGMIFQEPRLANMLTGWENIFLPIEIAGLEHKFDQQLLNQLLEVFFLNKDRDKAALNDKLHQKVSKYSGGEMQRIAIIRAMLTLPKFIFADEILNSVEPELQESTWLAIKKICKERDIGFLLVTHNPTLLKDKDFSRHYYIEKGKFK